MTTDAGTAAFLPPGKLDTRTRRRHRIILVILMAFGLLKGAYWVVLTPAWSAIDEAQHFGYVEFLARGHGIPTVGEDLVSNRELASIKASPTSPYRNHPYQPSAGDKNWGATAHQYEAIHGPTYYALMAPAYWLGAPFGIAGSLYAIRLATTMLAVLAVPLVWLLARRLFPNRPTIWIASAAVLVVFDSLAPGSVGNEPMVLVLGTTSMVLLLRSLDNPSKPIPAALFGIACAATIVTKTTSLALIPFSAVLLAAWVLTRRPPWRSVLRWTTIVGIAAITTVAPWLAWNYATYGAPSAASQAEELTGDLQQAATDFSFEVVDTHFDGARRSGVWSNQLGGSSTYTHYWEWVFVITASIGIIASVLRRQWRDLGSIAWCASALPWAFLSLEAIVWIVFGGGGGPTGRHLVVGLGPTAIAIAAGCVLAIGSRWGVALIATISAGALALAVPMYHNVINAAYLNLKRINNVAPVLNQTWSDNLVPAEPIKISTECPVHAISLGFQGAVIPLTITVSTDDGKTVTGDLDQSTMQGEYVVRQFIPAYQLNHVVTGTITVTGTEGAGINIANGDVAPWLSMGETDHDPVVIVFCQVQGSDEVAFNAIYPILHPGWVSLGLLRSTPIALAGVGVGVAIGTLSWAVTGSFSDFRRRRRDL